MVKPRLIWLTYFLAFCCASITDAEDTDQQFIPGDDGEDLIDFWATRGKKSDESGSGGQDGTNDLIFWANRGKRSDGHYIPRPNGFLFPVLNRGNFDKRAGQAQYNVPKPNGFFFPSANKRWNFFPMDRVAKREASAEEFNVPRPNGFFFPSKGKRGSSINRPNPNGFLIPVSSRGKRGDNVEDIGGAAWSARPRPNGFFFGALPKRSADAANIIWNRIRPNGFLFPSNKRDDISADTFFAGRGKRNMEHEDALDAFFAGRGRRTDTNADEMAANTFFAGRGKKAATINSDTGRDKRDVSAADLDAFFAGRGRRAVDGNFVRQNLMMLKKSADNDKIDPFWAVRGKRGAQLDAAEESNSSPHST